VPGRGKATARAQAGQAAGEPAVLPAPALASVWRAVFAVFGFRRRLGEGDGNEGLTWSSSGASGVIDRVAWMDEQG
jgi:hypothetical protein